MAALFPFITTLTVAHIYGVIMFILVIFMFVSVCITSTTRSFAFYFYCCYSIDLFYNSDCFPLLRRMIYQLLLHLHYWHIPNFHVFNTLFLNRFHSLLYSYFPPLFSLAFRCSLLCIYRQGFISAVYLLVYLLFASHFFSIFFCMVGFCVYVFT